MVIGLAAKDLKICFMSSCIETDSVTSPLYPQALATASALAEARMAVEQIIKSGIIFSYLRRKMVQAIIIVLPFRLALNGFGSRRNSAIVFVYYHMLL
jgi:hypothetical protein